MTTRYALSGHLDGVGVTQLVWCEASAHAGARGDPTSLLAGGWR
jgi:hypothetical protein